MMNNFKKWYSLIEQEKSLINEMDWYEKSPFAKTLARHRGKWVHFTKGTANRKNVSDEHLDAVPSLQDFQAKYSYDWKRAEKEYKTALSKASKKNATHDVPRLGFNPKPSHSDPIGIYFYPIDWILNSRFDGILRGDQYGFDYKFYYICDINLSSNGIDLQTVSWKTIENLATKNGWKEEYDKFKEINESG